MNLKDVEKIMCLEKNTVCGIKKNVIDVTLCLLENCNDRLSMC